MEPTNTIPQEGQNTVSLNEQPLIKLESTDLGPGAIAQSRTVGAPGFVLPAKEWISIQNYVINALALPTTLEKFKISLGPGAPDKLDDFKALVDAYAIINTNVTKWQNDTFPKSVSLASDVYAYAQEAPVYYAPILDLAQALVINPADATAKAELKEILQLLKEKANAYHDKAVVVENEISDFFNKTTLDKITLTGPKGDGGLKKHYNDKYGATSADIIRLKKELDAQKVVLDAANDEYNHDVVVAATTPTYVWVWPFGTVAAAIVAGIYGDKAVKALERVRAAEQQIKNISDELAADALLLIAVNHTSAGISDILGYLNEALPIIGLIKGVWGAIAKDLDHIIDIITKNIENVGPAIMKFGVKAAITAWTQVGDLANEYRLHAYVTISK